MSENTPNYIPVVDHKNLGRDPHSKGIVNVDTDAVYAARRRKEALNKKKEEELRDKQRLDTLEKDVSEMKGMLAQILEHLK